MIRGHAMPLTIGFAPPKVARQNWEGAFILADVLHLCSSRFEASGINDLRCVAV
jgi:hypothetical protein